MSIIPNFRRLRIPFFSSFTAFFDLGTTLTRIGVEGRGVVMREPSYIGYNSKIKDYIFFGQEAKTILGKTPDFIQISRPMSHAIISDFDAEVAFLRHCIETSIKPYLAEYSFIKPPILAVASTPSIATEIERKAVEESLQKSGCTQVTIIDRALATAAGSGFNVFSHEPQLVIDIGGGLVEISVVSGGGVVAQKVLKQAGDNMNKLIANYAYLKHGIVLGENTCEDLKIKLLSFTENEDKIVVRGKSLETGLPKSITLKSSDIRESLISQFHAILDATRELIENAPPEIADAIFKQGIALAGKIATVPGIEKYFHQELQIDTFVVEHAADATIHGLMRLAKDQESLHNISSPTY
ncbi:MAG: rod shape-determining protein [bacterium]|nr:rod shape-determining protein [bacterium]